MAIEVVTTKHVGGKAVKHEHETANGISVSDGHLYVTDARGAVAIYAPEQWVSAKRSDA